MNLSISFLHLELPTLWSNYLSYSPLDRNISLILINFVNKFFFLTNFISSRMKFHEISRILSRHSHACTAVFRFTCSLRKPIQNSTYHKQKFPILNYHIDIEIMLSFLKNKYKLISVILTTYTYKVYK